MSHPILPWAETNQGLLSAVQVVFSSVALIVALFALWNECRSARRAAERRIAEYVGTALSLIDRLVAEADTALQNMRSSPDGGHISPMLEWVEKRRLTYEALEAIRMIPPPDAQLAVAMADVAGSLRGPGAPAAIDRESRECAMAYVESELLTLRQKRSAIIGANHV